MLDVKLSIPEKFRRGALRKNEPKSVAQGVAMVERVAGKKPVEGARVLDFGCGVKIGQALYQMDSPQALYVGVDVYKAMIEHMQEALAKSPKYILETVPFQNDMYNKGGEPMTSESRLPIKEENFDIILMFSVITHMIPEHSAAVLAILRKYVAQDGRLFFWAFANDEQEEDFLDFNPEKSLLNALYRRDFLEDIIRTTGWQIEEIRRGNEPKIEHRKTHYICSPA